MVTAADHGLRALWTRESLLALTGKKRENRFFPRKFKNASGTDVKIFKNIFAFLGKNTASFCKIWIIKLSI
jgi:hypothetical protein